MAYSDFTLDSLRHKFGLTIEFTTGVWRKIPPVPLPSYVTDYIQRNSPLAIGGSTEKARSEWLVAPLLAELYHETNRQVVVLSGVEFNVDRKQGLHGFCDYLVSRSPGFITVDAPVVSIVEAKKEDLNPGVAQCLAAMVAARVYNEQKKHPTPVVYGCVTSGTAWRFLQLKDTTATVDLEEVYIADADKIFGILLFMARGTGSITPPAEQ